jgi:hypothetical protein
MALLPDDFRRTLMLRLAHSMSYDEIAAREGIALGTVMSRLHRCRLSLRESLGAYSEDLGYGERSIRLGASMGIARTERGDDEDWGEIREDPPRPRIIRSTEAATIPRPSAADPPPNETTTRPPEPGPPEPTPPDAADERKRMKRIVVAIMPAEIPNGQFEATALLNGQLIDITCQASRKGGNLVMTIDYEPECRAADPAPAPRSEAPPAPAPRPRPPINHSLARIPMTPEIRALAAKMKDALGVAAACTRLGFTSPQGLYNLVKEEGTAGSAGSITPERLQILRDFKTRSDQ